MSDVEHRQERHCPQCHEAVVACIWLCGCIRCPKCGYCFKSCISVMPQVKVVTVGTCSKCGKPITTTRVIE